MKTHLGIVCMVLLACWKVTGQTLIPVADAYVRDGTFSGQNFGTETNLVIKNDALHYNRDAYIKFSFTNISPVGTARLRVYARRSGSSLNLEVYSVGDSSWQERLITWSNAPVRVARLASRRVDSTSWKWYEFDLSDYVRSEQSAGKTAVSMALRSSYESDSIIYAMSRESAANQPQLVLVSNAPPVVGLRSDIIATDGSASNTVTLSATASDPDGKVSSVAFRVNSSTLVTLSNSPYVYSWSNVPPGQYEIAAVAMDNLGLQTISAPVVAVVRPRLEADGIVGAWDFDEGAGLISADLTGGRRDATLGPATRWVAGRSNTAVAGAEITIPNTNNLLPRTGGEFTLSMWINANAIPAGWSALAGSGDTAARGWRFGIARDANQTNLVFWSTEHSGTLEARAAAFLTTGSWHQVAVTFDGAIGRIYLDGSPVGLGYGGMIASTSSVRIASMNGMQTFSGALDEVRLHRRALSHHEIGPIGNVGLVTVLQGVSTNVFFNGHVGPGRSPVYQIIAPGPTNGFLSALTETQVVYNPNAGYKGPDAFQYTVSDGTFTSAPVTVVISVVKPHYLSPSGGALLQDGRAPDRAWAASSFSVLDEIIRTNNWYDCFFYSTGLFEMSGGHYGLRRTANWGCKHIGSGPGTVLRYVNAWDEVNDDTLFNAAACGPAARTDDFQISDLTIDCNAAGNPKFVRGLPYTLTLSLGAPRTIEAVRIVWDQSRPAGTTYQFGHAREFGVSARRAGTADYVLIHTNGSAGGGTGGVETVAGFQPLITDELRIVLGARGSLGTNDVGLYSIREIEVFSGGTNVALNQQLVATDVLQHDKYFEWAGLMYVPARAVDGDYNTQWTSRGQGQAGALFITGNNLKFTNLRVIGFGTTAGRECFPFAVNDGCYSERTKPLGNILIENVTITSPLPKNGDGCTALVLSAVKPLTMTNAVVRNCRVAGLRENFTYSHAYSTHHLENSYAMRCSQGWYIEPAALGDDIGPVLIRSNEFLRCDIGICIQFHPGAQFSSIVAERNQFFHDNTYPSWSFLSIEHGQNCTTNLIFNRNVISRAAGPSHVETLSGGVFLQSVWNALIGSHRFSISTNFINMVSSLAPPGARRAMFANTNGTGALVPIGDYSSGLISTNLQWPE